MGARLDARDKATGATRYSADLRVPGMLHAAVVRSSVAHGRVRSVDPAAALAVDGVVAVVTAADLGAGLGGRRVRDMPVLAGDVVRYVGEGVAAVLARSRAAAEQAAGLVEVGYEELPAVFGADVALRPGAPALHDAAWRYDGAVVGPDDHPNLQSEVNLGSPDATSRALAASAWSVDQAYSTPGQQQGYLEAHAWLAVPEPGGRIRLAGTTKAPYRLRDQILDCLRMQPGDLEVEAGPVGGDFGGKGGLNDAPVCVALARLSGKPVRLVLRSSEDLSTTDGRHPGTVAVRLGCDAQGALTALEVDALFDGGAYAGAKPIPTVNLHGAMDAALGYRIPAFAIRSRIAYTNSPPRGHMRAPGALQSVFAVESALDELAGRCGLSPLELRRRNLLGDGDVDAYGHRWAEARGAATLMAAADRPATTPAPQGWLSGSGVAMYARPTKAAPTALCLRRQDGRLVVDVPVPETGTGNHTAIRELVAARIGVDPAELEIRQVATSELPYDPGVGASRVTVGMAAAADELGRMWVEHGGAGPVTACTDGSDEEALSYCAQAAHVAVDPDTGQVRVLEIVTALDVAHVVNERAHQLQIDGGAVMGYGAACMEDTLEQDGQVWAATLAELKLPAAEDVPLLTTVLVRGGRGVGPAGVKSVGEMSNVAVPAAVANAIADAAGARLRALPLTAERVLASLDERAAP